MKNIADIEEKKKFGAQINALKTELETLFLNSYEAIERAEIEKKLANQFIDITLPIKDSQKVGIHPVMHVAREISSFLQTKYGFLIVDGPEIEDEYHNFDALNIKATHPARSMHDTFYLDVENEDLSNKKLLRTHTTTTEIRKITKYAPQLKSGEIERLALTSYGKTYRCDFDRTHTPMFHQLEGIYISKDVSFANLKYIVEDIINFIFEGKANDVRFRPSFFPFTEPSCEVDINMGNGYLEVMGCGMLHPNVLKNCGVDSNVYRGFAFGLGLERFAMLKYSANDLRDFFGSSKEWMEYYNV